MSKAVKRSGLLHWLRYNVFDPPSDGLMISSGAWRVLYPPDAHCPEGGVSIRMTYGTACDYADLYKGEVIKAKDTP